MKSPVHPITGTKGHYVPSLCVFLDTETVSVQSQKSGIVHETFKLAVAIKVQRERGQWGRRELCRFTRGDRLWHWLHGLESFRRPVWVFAHNLGFDLTVSGFWDHVNAGVWGTRDLWPIRGDRSEPVGKPKKPWRGSLVLTDPPTIVVMRSKKGSLRLVDTFNYFRGSIDQMGKSIGIDKLARPAPESGREEWFNYCRRDVEILERTVCGWLDQWACLDCGSWKPTAAGLGYSAWRSSLKGIKVIPDHSEQQLTYARGSYYGGQVEVFYRGEIGAETPREATRGNGNRNDGHDAARGLVYHLDVCALYPSVMRGRCYPSKYLAFEASPGMERLEARAQFHIPIACVTIESKEETYPLRTDKSYLHAVGRFRTYLAGPELLGAIRRGHVVKVHGVCWYQGADLFTRFVDRWLALRREHERSGDSTSALLDKVVTNSLSGKFAQHRVVWVDRPDLAAFLQFGEWQVWDRDTRKLSRFRAIGGNVQEYTFQGEGRESFPAISACITAAGRERMRELRAKCPARSVLYQDTDSLFVLPSGFEALAESGEIALAIPGKLQEVAQYTSLEVRGVKFYGNGDFVICPGLKKDAREIKPGKYNQSRFQRLADKLSEYDGPHIAVQATDFTPVGSLGNRIAGTDGWTLPPTVWEPVAQAVEA